MWVEHDDNGPTRVHVVNIALTGQPKEFVDALFKLTGLPKAKQDEIMRHQQPKLRFCACHWGAWMLVCKKGGFAPALDEHGNPYLPLRHGELAAARAARGEAVDARPSPRVMKQQQRDAECSDPHILLSWANDEIASLKVELGDVQAKFTAVKFVERGVLRRGAYATYF